MARKLLLADDSVTVQRVIELTFADEGMEVVSVNDGAKAIARMEQERPDIVLADVSMRGLDGYQLSEHIKNNPATTHVPVVLMTGAFEPLDEERAKRVRCDAVLAKPFEPQMAIALVQQLLSGGSDAQTPQEPPAETVTSPAAMAVAPVAPAPVAMAPAAAPAATPRPGGPKTLDDYLERLDDALTHATSPLSLRALNTIATAPAPDAAATAPAGAPASESSSANPSDLAAAFSSLLEEELGDTRLSAATWTGLAAQTAAAAAPAPAPVGARAMPSPATATAPVVAAPVPATVSPVLSEDVLDDIAKRVALRLTDTVIRDLVSQRVLEIAERLVRDEIERIKGSVR